LPRDSSGADRAFEAGAVVQGVDVRQGYRRNPDGSLSKVKGVVENWTVSLDAMQITMRLRKGVKWHDGSEATAEDLAYTLYLCDRNVSVPSSFSIHPLMRQGDPGPPGGPHPPLFGPVRADDAAVIGPAECCSVNA
jgi:ABC-type transport system substrate-binding protein